MKLNGILRYVAGTGRILTAVITLLTVVLILEGSIIGIMMAFVAPPREIPTLGELTPAELDSRRISRSRKEFLPDGTIHLIYEKNLGGSYRQELNVYDANDNLLWTGFTNDLPYEHIEWAISGRSVLRNPASYLDEMQWISLELSRSMIIPVVDHASRIIERWKYVPTKRHFIGYGSNGNIIGYAGASGFVQSDSKVQPFESPQSLDAWSPADSSSPVLMWRTRQHVYEIRFESRQVEILFDLPGSMITRAGMNTSWRNRSGETKTRPMFYAATDDGRQHVLFDGPTERLTLVPPQAAKIYDVKLAIADEKVFLTYYGREGGPAPKDLEARKRWNDKWRTKPGKLWTELYRMNQSDGWKLVTRFEWMSVPWKKYMIGTDYDKFVERTKACVTILSPPVFMAAWAWEGYVKEMYLQNRSRREWNFLARLLVDVIIKLHPRNSSWNLILALAMVLLAGWHGWPRRTSYVTFGFWIVFVGAFGLTGLLTYLALNHTPVIRCEKCRKRRGLRNPNCPACNAELPVPEPREVDLMLNRPC